MTVNESINRIKQSLPEYFVQNQTEVLRMILKSKHICFLDTCFVSRLRHLPDIMQAFAAAERIAGGTDAGSIVFVLSSLVLFEMKDSESHIVQRANMVLFDKANKYGFTFVVLDEEQVCDSINAYIQRTKIEWNKFFLERLSDNKANLTKLFTCLYNSDNTIYLDIANGKKKSDRNTDFICNTIRNIKDYKNEKDSLAEELIAVSLFFLLELLRESKRNIILFCSHDFPAINRINRVIRTSYFGEDIQVRPVSFFSFVEYMVMQDFINNQEELEAVMKKVLPDKMKVVVQEKLPIQSVPSYLTCDEVIENMMRKVHQNYVGKMC